MMLAVGLSYLVFIMLKYIGFNSWVRKIPWSRKWNPIPVLFSGKLHGQRSLVGYSPWSCKELDMTERARTHRLLYLVFVRRCEWMTFSI